jgi:hypothetical protein
MKNQFINVSNLEMSELSVNELEMINGGKNDGNGKIAAGVACIAVAAVVECFSAGWATPVAAEMVNLGIGLIGSGITSN